MPESNNTRTKSKPKRKGVWSEIHTFEHPESGLVCIVTERTRGVSAYSFQIAHMDDKGFNKFIPCPVPGTIDVEHIVKSLAESAHQFITQKIAEDTEVKSKRKNDKDSKNGKNSKNGKDDKKGTCRGSRGKSSSRDDRRSKNGLSTLAKADAAAGGHQYIGPTKRQHEKKRAAKGAT